MGLLDEKGWNIQMTRGQGKIQNKAGFSGALSTKTRMPKDFFKYIISEDFSIHQSRSQVNSILI
jgi:hypothetical protein